MFLWSNWADYLLRSVNVVHQKYTFIGNCGWGETAYLPVKYLDHVYVSRRLLQEVRQAKVLLSRAGRASRTRRYTALRVYDKQAELQESLGTYR